MKNTTPQTSLESFHKYIGTPYTEYDCYEIIQLFYAQELNCDLPELYSNRPTTQETEDFYLIQKNEFKEVETPAFGDIIVFRVFGLACHVGMYVNDEVFFHSRQNVNCNLEKLSVWKKRVVGYYRWPQLN